ncbi:MAG: hypothetical protein QOJ53_733 [Sphingomonadales bacterium]|jgi:spore coat protein U-like protein|nr:hypothetical protein [Sphingomonadales bacterium]MEA3046401.1 hypothetical protein [Sphingomonadales bacterium]
MRRVRPALIGGALLAVAAAATPARACTISAPGVAFGAYDPRAAGADDSSGTIGLACPTASTTVIIALSTGSSGTYTTRTLKNGATNLNYNLYRDSTRTQIWGNGTAGTVTQTLSPGTLGGGTRNYTTTVYGRIPALQNVRAGAYGDTITVTVTF